MRDDLRVLVHHAYQIWIYPTRKKASLLSKTFGRTRFTIVIEDLNIQGLKRWNGGFAKITTLDTAWDTFTCMLG